jgi:toxin ParE1/3/4
VTLQLSYTEEALADLDDIYEFIALDNPVRAETHVDNIKKACRSLCETPFIGVSRNDLGPDIRILNLWRRIVVAYQVVPGRVEVLRVFSGGQDYEAILGSN